MDVCHGYVRNKSVVIKCPDGASALIPLKYITQLERKLGIKLIIHNHKP